MRPKPSSVRELSAKLFPSIAALLLALYLFWPTRLVAQEKPKAVELVFFYGLNSRGFSSDYLHQYSPPFEPGEALSSASHYQQFESTKSRGGAVSLGIFPGRYFGVELSYFHQCSPLAGTSSDYEVFLRYTSRPPPSYDPIEMSLHRTHPWPAPHGYLDLKILTLNPALRFSSGRRWQLGLSAGLASFFLKGELGPVAFTRFWLGGHSVLFSEEYKLLVRFIPNHQLGWYGAVSVSAGFAAGIGLTLDLRYYRSPVIPLKLEAADYDKDYEQQGIEPLTKMGPHLGLSRVLFRPNFLSLKLGLKLSFL